MFKPRRTNHVAKKVADRDSRAAAVDPLVEGMRQRSVRDYKNSPTFFKGAQLLLSTAIGSYASLFVVPAKHASAIVVAGYRVVATIPGALAGYIVVLGLLMLRTVFLQRREARTAYRELAETIRTSQQSSAHFETVAPYKDSRGWFIRLKLVNDSDIRREFSAQVTRHSGASAAPDWGNIKWNGSDRDIKRPVNPNLPELLELARADRVNVQGAKQTALDRWCQGYKIPLVPHDFDDQLSDHALLFSNVKRWEDMLERQITLDIQILDEERGIVVAKDRAMLGFKVENDELVPTIRLDSETDRS